MRVANIWNRYSLDLKIPNDVRRRISKWISSNIKARGFLGCHAKLKAVCSRLRVWLVSHANSDPMPSIRDYVANTASGFPKILDGLQHLDTRLLWKLVGLHKIFKTEICDGTLPRRAEIQARVNAVIEPYTGERSALREGQRLIAIGSRALSRPNVTSDTSNLSIYTPRHPLTPQGVLWLREFFLKNESWLNVADGENIFAPYSVRQPVPTDWVNNGAYEVFTNGGKRSSFVDPTFTCLGSYQLAPEPGFKARAFFAPNLVVQCLSHPLYKALERVEIQSGRSVRYLETEAKLSQVQEWLREGHTVWSIDQTAATDRFHVLLQKFYLHCSGVNPEWIRFIHKLSIGKWHVDEAFKGVYDQEYITLAVGQPMGVKYSMPLYTVTLIALLEGAAKAWGWEPDFLVLGDDLVIKSPELARWFEEFAPKIGISISKTKGIVSNNIAEFAGAIIGADWYVFPGKYPIPHKGNWVARCESFACPLPGGPTGDPVVDAESFWDARIARLTGVGQLASPIYHRKAAVDLLNLRSSTNQRDLEHEYFLYQSRRYAKTCRKLARELKRGRIISVDRWVAEHIGYVLGHPSYIHDTFQQLEVAKGMELTKIVLDEAWSAIAHVEHVKATRLFSFLKPQGQTFESRVAHTLDRVAELLDEQAGPKGSLTPFQRTLLVTAMGRVLQHIRETLWDKMASTYASNETEVFGFVAHLAHS